MQIKKINNNKLKVTLDLNDLNKNNIDVDSFLSNSIESQNLFFDILDLAEEKYDFNIENNKAIVEAISLDNNIFILTITKLNNLSISLNDTSSKIYLIKNSHDFFDLLLSIKNTNINNLNDLHIYKLNNQFYAILKNSTPLENLILEYSCNQINNDYLEDILIEYGNKVSI